MNYFALLMSAILTVASSSTPASSKPFDGTWVTRVSTMAMTGKPDTWLLVDGQLTCGMCYPGLTIPADGQRHPVSGHAYYDTAAAEIVNARSVKMWTWLKGKPVDDRLLEVTPDGNHLTFSFAMHDANTPSSGAVPYARVGPVLAGAHAISGSWMQVAKDTKFSPDLLTITFKSFRGGIAMTNPTGRSYRARFDNSEYPMSNDNAKTTVKLRRINARSFVAEYLINHAPSKVMTYTLSKNDATILAVEEDKLRSTRISYVADRH